MSIKNLSDSAAIEEIKHLAENKVAIFCTWHDEKMMPRPMGTLQIDDDGSFWFFSKRESNKNRQIKMNPKVQLIYAEHGKAEYLAIDGSATISRDQKKIDELWSPLVKSWFPEGKDDPELTLLHVKPSGGHYWDTQHGKMIALFLIAAGAITGKPADVGVHGKLQI